MIRYPSTPCIHDTNLAWFLGKLLIITEKLDGLNVLLHNGAAYTRDLSAEPHDAPYMSLVKKHHAWKTFGDGVFGYWGEDLYAQHSCQYLPMREDETFKVFMVANVKDEDAYVLPFNFGRHRALARELELVPILFSGRFSTVMELRAYLDSVMEESVSVIGGDLEGLIVRVSQGFYLRDLPRSVFKIVRPHHVQPDAEHWRANWRPRPIIWERINSG